MILKPYSFYGTSLQSSDYQAEFPREQSNLQLTSNPMYIRRSGAVPVYAGKDFQPAIRHEGRNAAPVHRNGRRGL
jgi:hypothetical protein